MGLSAPAFPEDTRGGASVPAFRGGMRANTSAPAIPAAIRGRMSHPVIAVAITWGERRSLAGMAVPSVIEHTGATTVTTGEVPTIISATGAGFLSRRGTFTARDAVMRFTTADGSL